jgi:N-acetylglucosamine-6-sulfatase
MSAVGHPFVKTPNMDRLAKEGVLFQNAFVTTSLCSPSRASFLTGTYAHTHGVRNNLTPWKSENLTFLEALKTNGYDTAFIGKWHMPGKLPSLKGVDEFVTFTVQGGQGRYFNCPLIVNGKKTPPGKAYITEELTDRGIAFIEKKREKPFCLYLSHKAVHHQFLPPDDLKHIYDEQRLRLPQEMNPYVHFTDGNLFYGLMGSISFLYRNYCEALVAMDREIGRLLNRLDELGLSEDTLVVYASDNGYFWGEHNLVDKRYAYEESIRIPWIVRYPKLIKDPGRAASQMVLNVDLAATLLDAAGIDVPSTMDGMSFLPVLKAATAQSRKAWLYEYFSDYPYRVPPHYAVRTDTHKYIEFRGSRGAELYNIISDPKEKNNLIGTAEGQKLLPELKRMLKELKAGKQL